MAHLYIRRDFAGNVVEFYEGNYRPGFECVSHDLASDSEAEFVAEQLTEIMGKRMIATNNCSYRNIIAAPVVGTEVSYTFNGDFYPCGVITKVSKSLRRVQTSTGRVFFRVKNTGVWLSNGTWALVYGHRSERNPHF